MIRAAIIGNSHIACMRHAWPDRAPHFPGISCDFFGAPGRALKEIEIVDGYLQGGSDRTRTLLEMRSENTRLRIDEYDYIAVAGLGFFARPAVDLFVNFRPWPAPEDVTLVSHETFLRATAAQLERTLAVGLLDRLRRETAASIFLIAQPCLLPLALDTPETAEPWAGVAAHGDAIYDLFTQAAERVAARRQAIFLRQPPQTRQGLFTLAEFHGGVRATDSAHMNTIFGGHVMDMLADRLAAAPSANSLPEPDRIRA